MSSFGLSEFEIVEALGNLDILLAFLAVALYLSRRINKYAYTNRNAMLKKVSLKLSKFHPYIGIGLVVTALVHGQLALGTLLKVHTGPVILYLLVLTMLVALVGKQYRLKYWLEIHRILAILIAIAIFVHLVARNILG
jgi:hypothetical protein